ncbi:Trm112 family protein [Dethiosulfatarculus sandiegensis]|uniref:UPF0434 protein X474_16500 n=1 Tax=Dethiosulfatarculus sandiegensis TaxID=1429043 RepID=A0A0D2HQY0_9BACT|nr:Trm112 family protein [Dethiosulfatarculus sandiegensis]KIX12888.1 hypothetical protein X474_16500 [Dethiosulfatarculus sandiegensis]
MAIDRELLKILACPKCRGQVELSPDQNWLICSDCRLKYRIENDIPVMLIEEAKSLEG